MGELTGQNDRIEMATSILSIQSFVITLKKKKFFSRKNFLLCIFPTVCSRDKCIFNGLFSYLIKQALESDDLGAKEKKNTKGIFLKRKTK